MQIKLKYENIFRMQNLLIFNLHWKWHSTHSLLIDDVALLKVISFVAFFDIEFIILFPLRTMNNIIALSKLRYSLLRNLWI